MTSGDVLISVAPKLFDACKEFVRFVNLPSKSVPRGDYIRYQVSAINAAEAAIAEVEEARAKDNQPTQEKA